MYSFNTKIRYSELDEHLKLPLVSLVNLFQDASTYQSETTGKGIDYLKSHHRAWLLNSWQIELFSMPDTFAHVKVSTWPHKFDRVMGYRNFTLTSPDDSIIYAAANSLWALVDTDRLRACGVHSEDTEGYTVEPAYPMEYLPRKISLTQGDYITCSPVPIVNAHLDSNHHVNNGQYLSIADDSLPDGFSYNRVRAEYRKSAVIGDIIYPKYILNGDVCQMLLSDADSDIYTIVEFSSRQQQEQ